MKSTAFKPVFILALLACLVSGAGAQAACTYFDDFQENGDGTVTDPRDGLVWQKCALGQEWTGSGCSGRATEMNWLQAMKAAKKHRFLGKKDWRLPSKDEMLAVVGDNEQCKNQPTPARAASRSLAYPAHDDGYLGFFWSASSVASDPSEAWLVAFGNSYDDGHGKGSNDYAVRLVRGGQSFGALEFAREYAKLGQYQRQIEAAHRESERRAKESEARWQVERANACSNVYPGKTGTYKRGGYFATEDDYVVRYVNKDQGTATIQGAGRQHTTSLNYGEMREIPCGDL